MVGINKNSHNIILRGIILILLCGIFVHAQLVFKPVEYLKPVVERWVYTHNAVPGLCMDEAKAIAYGKDGNIYAAGGIKGVNPWSDYDFTIISLTSSGNERWIYTYSGTPDEQDLAFAIVSGDDGNLYAAGHSHSSGVYHDFTVISVATNGNQRWVYTYPNSYATSIAYGKDGKIYAAGYTVCTTFYGEAIVICLDSNGNQQWVYKQDSAYVNAIVHGDDGNVYVVGTYWNAGSYGDYMIISINSNGNERWIRTYDGTGYEYDWWDEAFAIAYGLDGNIYTAGKFIQAGPDFDFVVMSFDTSGNQRWLYTHSGPGYWYDEGKAIVYGDDGNIYATGTSNNSHNFALTVVKLKTDGTEKWVYKYYRPSPYAFSWGNAIVYGSNGIIYAAGGLNNWEDTDNRDFTYWDFIVISLTQQGCKRWVYKFNGTASGDDEAYSLVHGDDGYIYIAGYNTDSTHYKDFTVISLKDQAPIPHPLGNVADDTRKLEKDNADELGVEGNPQALSETGNSIVFKGIASDKIALTITLSSPTHVEVQIFDLAGREIETLLNIEMPAGENMFEHSSNLPNGIYFVRVKAGSIIKTGKVMIVK